MILAPAITVLVLATISFIVAFAATPLLTNFLYKYKLGKSIRQAGDTPIYSQLHKAKQGTPTMGGMLIWGTTIFLALVIYLGTILFPGSQTVASLNFLSRSQTYLPLGALIAAALVGMVDDLFNIARRGPKGGGLMVRHKLMLYVLIATVGAWWFYFKLDWDVLHIPFWGNVSIGPWYILFFIIVIVATAFSVNEIDGLDGLSGGTLLSAFAALGAIAFVQGRFSLASFCAVITGALAAFLWYNIFPARFFMGDTGSMSLGVTLGIVAMLTNTALFLPVIGFLFVVETLSVIIQLTSKKLFGRKVFLSAPIHHHFEAKGWPEPKVVMRFWVIAGITAVLGLALVLLDQTWMMH